MMPTAAQWWVLKRPNPAADVRLFCFPYAGGTASLFRSWHLELPKYVEVYAIQLPGRANRRTEPPFRQVSDLIPTLAAALMPLLDRPFVLFGHSLGAIISFETARWLSHHHRIPSHLVVSGRRAPHLTEESVLKHLLSDDEFLAAVLQLKGIPPLVANDPEILKLVLPVLRADFEMGETYAYSDGIPLPCPITAFGGADDAEITDGKLEAWKYHTSHSFSCETFYGDHFYLHSCQSQILKFLRDRIIHGLR